MKNTEVENLILKNNIKERDCSNSLYAEKWVQKVIIWAGTIFGGAVILAFARLILK